MAQFRATIEGNRGMASRLGTKKSGLSAKVNAWNIGISVDLTHRDGKDVATVYLTGGSNARTNPQLIGEYMTD